MLVGGVAFITVPVPEAIELDDVIVLGNSTVHPVWTVLPLNTSNH